MAKVQSLIFRLYRLTLEGRFELLGESTGASPETAIRRFTRRAVKSTLTRDGRRLYASADLVLRAIEVPTRDDSLADNLYNALDGISAPAPRSSKLTHHQLLRKQARTSLKRRLPADVVIPRGGWNPTYGDRLAAQRELFAVGLHPLPPKVREQARKETMARAIAPGRYEADPNRAVPHAIIAARPIPRDEGNISPRGTGDAEIAPSTATARLAHVREARTGLPERVTVDLTA